MFIGLMIHIHRGGGSGGGGGGGCVAGGGGGGFTGKSILTLMYSGGGRQTRTDSRQKPKWPDAVPLHG